MNRLKELRLASEMKQEDLASRLSVKRQTVSRYENGLLDLDTATIARICAIFNCTSDFLLGLSTQRTAQISDDDAELLAAYKRAPDSVRAAISASVIFCPDMLTIFPPPIFGRCRLVCLETYLVPPSVGAVACPARSPRRGISNPTLFFRL